MVIILKNQKMLRMKGKKIFFTLKVNKEFEYPVPSKSGYRPTRTVTAIQFSGELLVLDVRKVGIRCIPNLN